MQTKDHYAIARYLACDIGHFNSQINRLAFMFGCVLPDINPFSYLKGKGSMGHSFAVRRKTIERELLSLPQKQTMLTCLRLGIAMHYLQDSFTFVHNKQSKAGFSAHLSYESRLHIILGRYLSNTQIREKLLYTSTRMFPLKELHQKYSARKSCAYNDCAYILFCSKAALHHSGITKRHTA